MFFVRRYAPNKKSIKAAEVEIADGKSRAVVKIAKQALKMYEMHLQMAEAAL